jgi:transposase
LTEGPPASRASVELRDVFNAILYVNRTGIPWKYLPHDFPNHGTVYAYYAAWRDEGIFAQLNYDLPGLARAKEGRKPEPTASVIDTQSVKTSTNVPLTSQGTDAAKKIVGRKRGILTDTLGLLLAVIVTAASLSENAVGIQLLDQAKKTYPTITKSWVDTGFKDATPRVPVTWPLTARQPAARAPTPPRPHTCSPPCSPTDAPSASCECRTRPPRSPASPACWRRSTWLVSW